jgi:hypothetical protein
MPAYSNRMWPPPPSDAKAKPRAKLAPRSNTNPRTPEAKPRTPYLASTTLSGATISADTAAKLRQVIAHSEAAIAICQALLDGNDSADQQELRAKLIRLWDRHALN